MDFGHRRVVDDVTIEVCRGEIVGLLGPNGAGKTTAFNLIVGLLNSMRGQVYLEDREITRVPMYQRAHLGVAYLPQEMSCLRRLTVQQNLRLVGELRRLSRRECIVRTEGLIEEFGLQTVRDSYAIQLSGGERRRLEIARALFVRPRVLLLDEPFTGVDPIAITEIQAILHRLEREGMAILLTDHNLYDTLPLTRKVYILNEGRVIAQGDPADVAASAAVRESYLGERFYLKDRKGDSHCDA